MLPSALSRSDLVARCMLGVLSSAGAAICLATCRFTEEWNVAQAINAVTGTRLWGFCLFFFGNDFDFVLPIGFYAAAATVRLLLCNGSYASPLTHR
jgi:hypothetical protein